MPCPSASGATLKTSRPLRSPPTVGTINSSHGLQGRARFGQHRGFAPRRDRVIAGDRVERSNGRRTGTPRRTRSPRRRQSRRPPAKGTSSGPAGGRVGGPDPKSRESSGTDATGPEVSMALWALATVPHDPCWAIAHSWPVGICLEVCPNMRNRMRPDWHQDVKPPSGDAIQCLDGLASMTVSMPNSWRSGRGPRTWAKPPSIDARTGTSLSMTKAVRWSGRGCRRGTSGG